MKMAAIDKGEVDPGEVMEAVQLRIHGGRGRKMMISYRERKRRQSMCLKLIKQEGSPSAAARAVGVSIAQWHYWEHGTRPVPDKWMENLEDALKGRGK